MARICARGRRYSSSPAFGREQIGAAKICGGDEMRAPDFFDIVAVLDTEHTRSLGIAGEEGVILGKATEDETPDGDVVGYGVHVNGLGYSVDPDMVSPTGRRARREHFCSGESIRVSVDGEYLGPGLDSQRPADER